MPSYEIGYYNVSDHAYKRYRQRMGKHVKKEGLKKKIADQATRQEIARRINYMLLFSIYGEPGEGKNVEVRYYFDWDIVVNVKKKRVVTMYVNDKRPVPPADMFGDRQLRDMIYDLFFRPQSKLGRAVYA